MFKKEYLETHKKCSGYFTDEYDYCWSWAEIAIDKNNKQKCINEICPDCEYYIKD